MKHGFPVGAVALAILLHGESWADSKDPEPAPDSIVVGYYQRYLAEKENINLAVFSALVEDASEVIRDRSPGVEVLEDYLVWRIGVDTSRDWTCMWEDSGDPVPILTDAGKSALPVIDRIVSSYPSDIPGPSTGAFPPEPSVARIRTIEALRGIGGPEVEERLWRLAEPLLGSEGGVIAQPDSWQTSLALDAASELVKNNSEEALTGLIALLATANADNLGAIETALASGTGLHATHPKGKPEDMVLVDQEWYVKPRGEPQIIVLLDESMDRERLIRRLRHEIRSPFYQEPPGPPEDPASLEQYVTRLRKVWTKAVNERAIPTWVDPAARQETVE